VAHVRLFQAPRVVETMAACPVLRFVRRRDLSSNVLRNAHIATLARSPHLVNLESLGLLSNHLGIAGCQALAEAHLPAIRKLSLSSTPIRDRGLSAVLGADWGRGLTHLSVGICELTDRGVESLAGSPVVPHLRQLALAYGPHTAPSDEALAGLAGA